MVKERVGQVGGGVGEEGERALSGTVHRERGATGRLDIRGSWRAYTWLAHTLPRQTEGLRVGGGMGGWVGGFKADSWRIHGARGEYRF